MDCSPSTLVAGSGVSSRERLGGPQLPRTDVGDPALFFVFEAMGVGILDAGTGGDQLPLAGRREMLVRDGPCAPRGPWGLGIEEGVWYVSFWTGPFRPTRVCHGWDVLAVELDRELLLPASILVSRCFPLDSRESRLVNFGCVGDTLRSDIPVNEARDRLNEFDTEGVF